MQLILSQEFPDMFFLITHAPKETGINANEHGYIGRPLSVLLWVRVTAVSFW